MRIDWINLTETMYYQIVFLAKNKLGYENLMKMCSIGYTEGFYYVPRIDKDLVKKYKEGLIVLSGSNMEKYLIKLSM